MISSRLFTLRHLLGVSAVAGVITMAAAPASAQRASTAAPVARSQVVRAPILDDLDPAGPPAPADAEELEPPRRLSPARALLRAQVPVAAPAGPPRELLGFSADLSGYGMRHTDAGYQVLGKRDDRIGIGLEASYDTIRFGRAGRLAFGLGFVADRVGPSEDVNDLQVSFEGTSYYALAQARWRQDAAVQPYLTGALGMTHARLSIDSDYSYGQQLTGQANAAFARAGAGLRFMPPFLVVKKDQQRLLAFTVTVEAGALVGSGLGFDLRSEGRAPGASAAGGSIAVDPIRAGDLGSTATYARIGVGLAF
jgi:hypothetical protein